jgi:hypothetical protein
MKYPVAQIKFQRGARDDIIGSGLGPRLNKRRLYPETLSHFVAAPQTTESDRKTWRKVEKRLRSPNCTFDVIWRLSIANKICVAIK